MPILLTPQAARCYRLEHLLRRRGCVAFQELLELVGVSAATLKRDLQWMRTNLAARIEYDAWDNGYRLDPQWLGVMAKVHEEAEAVARGSHSHLGAIGPARSTTY